MTTGTQNSVVEEIFSHHAEQREIEERFLQRITAAHLAQRKGIVHLAEALMCGAFDRVLAPLAQKVTDTDLEQYGQTQAYVLRDRRKRT